MEQKNDKVGEYLTHHLEKILFDELSDDYLDRAGLADVLKGVPIPFTAEQLTSGATSTLMIASNMAYVIGCDRTFKYRDNYLTFISKTFPHDFDKPLLNEGVKAAQNEDPEKACIWFRAALQIAPDSQDALFLYARACKDAYENGEGEDYVGTFKAESIRLFEQLTIKYPDFDKGYYFLGYGYLNLGLYTKARLTFEEFMRTSMKAAETAAASAGEADTGAASAGEADTGAAAAGASPSVNIDPTDAEGSGRSSGSAATGHSGGEAGDAYSGPVVGSAADNSDENAEIRQTAELRAEVAEILTNLEDPCRIEAAINDISAGRYDRGVIELEPYTRDSRFSTYWPMWYYLGIAYRAGGNTKEAERHLLGCLRCSPSNTDAMTELAELYEETGDEEKAEKYRKKIDLVEHNRELDQLEKESERDDLQ